MRKRPAGQAILEYILMIVMLATTIAVVIRNTNLNIYCLWTGLARVISMPCPHCKAPSAPGVDQCVNLTSE